MISIKYNFHYTCIIWLHSLLENVIAYPVTDALVCLKIIQLWAYEVLRIYPPQNKCPDLKTLPHALIWSKEYMGTKEGIVDLNAFRLYLDELKASQV